MGFKNISDFVKNFNPLCYPELDLNIIFQSRRRGREHLPAADGSRAELVGRAQIRRLQRGPRDLQKYSRS